MINIELNILKKVVLILEFKIRERDPDMGVTYQDIIKNFYFNIKSFFQEGNQIEKY